MKKQKGFTLVEIIVTVAIIAILASIIIVAINPPLYFANARNSQRSSDVTQIVTGISQYLSEQGRAVADFGTVPTCPTTANIGTGGVNLSTTLVDKYIPQIPMDPSGGTAANTLYTICQSTNARITVAAPKAENGVTISIKR